MTIPELFDKILSLDDGQEIVLKFNNYDTMHSKRIMLFREKKKFESKMVRAKVAVFIRQELDTKNKVFNLRLSKCSLELDGCSEMVLLQDGKVIGLT